MIGIIIGSVCLGLFILFFVFLYYVYNLTFYSPKKWQNKELQTDKSLNYQGLENEVLDVTQKILDVPYEDLQIKSFDGLNLHAYLYRNESSNDFVIMFNGYRGVVRRDMGFGALEMIELKKNVILCDQRAHGKSEGHSITFGRKEQRDVVSWVNFVKEKWGNSVKITIVGISMGAATVLLASDKIDSNIKIIADCPYSSQKDVIKHSMKSLGLPPNLLWPFAYLAAIIFAHARLKDDALVNVSNSKCEILIFHGTADTIVPYKMSERVYLSNKDHVQYELFEGVEHGLSCLSDTPRYKKIVKEFLER